jgi:hypothetical protein
MKKIEHMGRNSINQDTHWHFLIKILSSHILQASNSISGNLSRRSKLLHVMLAKLVFALSLMFIAKDCKQNKCPWIENSQVHKCMYICLHMHSTLSEVYTKNWNSCCLWGVQTSIGWRATFYFTFLGIIWFFKILLLSYFSITKLNFKKRRRAARYDGSCL